MSFSEPESSTDGDADLWTLFYRTYEILTPEDFGMTRYVNIAHKLTG